MAQDDKMNEKGDATSLRKAPSSVVDDFLQALFARHPPPQDDNEAKVTRNDQQVSSASATGVKRDRTPDEFEEYEMLSKRKEQNTFGDESTTQRQDIVNMTPETRMLVRRLPPSIKRRDLLDHFSKYGTILEAYVKNSSGHVQFDNAESCQTAVQEENGKILKGVVLELEVDHRPPHKATREFTRPRPFGDSARDNSMDMDMSMSQVRNPNNGYQGGYTGNYSSVNGYQRDGQYELSRHITGSSVRRPYAGESGSHLSRAGRGSPGGMRPYPPRQHGYSRTDEFGRHNRFDMQSRQFRTQQSSYTGLSMSMSNGGAARDMGRPPMHGPVRGNYQMSMSTNSRGRAGGPVRGSYTSQRFDRRSERRTETIQAVNVPFVQAVVLGNVSQVFTDELERAFRERSISIRTRCFQRELFIRDAFVTKLVTEGVKALIIIEEGKSAHGKIYMQVFELDEGSGPNSYRFDEYDSLSVEEALAVLEQCKNEGKATRQVISSPTTSITSVRSNSNTRQTQQQVQYSSPGPSQAPQPVQAQPQQAPLPQVSAPASVPASVSAAAANLLDPNTLTTLINVVKGMIQQPAQQPAPIPQSMPQQPPVQQATVPVSQPVASIPQQTYNGYTSVPAYSPTQAVAPLQSLQTSAPPPPSPQQQQATAQTSGLLNNSTIQQLLAAVVGNPAGFTSGYQQPSFGNFIPTQPSAAAATTQTQPFQSHPQQQLSQPKSAPPQGFNTFNSSQVSDLLDKLQFLTRQQNPVPQHP